LMRAWVAMCACICRMVAWGLRWCESCGSVLSNKASRFLEVVVETLYLEGVSHTGRPSTHAHRQQAGLLHQKGVGHGTTMCLGERITFQNDSHMCLSEPSRKWYSANGYPRVSFVRLRPSWRIHPILLCLGVCLVASADQRTCSRLLDARPALRCAVCWMCKPARVELLTL
jgi:hypothetical protein